MDFIVPGPDLGYQPPLCEALFNRGVKNISDLRIGRRKVSGIDAGMPPEVLRKASTAYPRLAAVVMQQSAFINVVIVTCNMYIPKPIIATFFFY